ncbi:DUF3618 domain-containing protein [Actinopolymorpha sp. B9G3]|uniref:DUF3618 domain-containing protein n=1 Tax=Actinopolymorpha sp. B9G3 TaxID=3158970 RepID=UPI0032D93E8D
MSDRTRQRLPAQKEQPGASASREVAEKRTAGEKASLGERQAAGNRSAAEIERELTATRERLATTIDTLTERMQPKQMVSRGAAKAKLVVMTPDGRFRTGRVVTAVVAAGAVFGALKLLRGRLHDGPTGGARPRTQRLGQPRGRQPRGPRHHRRQGRRR